LSEPGGLPLDLVVTACNEGARARAAVTYVAGMTDRFAFEAATVLLGWNPDRLPKGIGRGA
jgi:dGTPase